MRSCRNPRDLVGLSYESLRLQRSRFPLLEFSHLRRNYSYEKYVALDDLAT